MSKTVAKSLAFSLIAMLVTGGFLAGLLLPPEFVFSLFAAFAGLAVWFAVLAIWFAVFAGFATGFAAVTGFVAFAGFAILAVFAGLAIPAAGFTVLAFGASNGAINNLYASKGA